MLLVFALNIAKLSLNRPPTNSGVVPPSGHSLSVEDHGGRRPTQEICAGPACFRMVSRNHPRCVCVLSALLLQQLLREAGHPAHPLQLQPRCVSRFLLAHLLSSSRNPPRPASVTRGSAHLHLGPSPSPSPTHTPRTPDPLPGPAPATNPHTRGFLGMCRGPDPGMSTPLVTGSSAATVHSTR